MTTNTRTRRHVGSRATTLLVALVSASFGLASPAFGAVAFSKGTLSGASVSRPTSLQFGPDGRLYVAQQNGLIKAFTVSRSGVASYAATATETIDLVNKMANRNDDGVVNSGVNGRLVTGIVVTGTAAAPVIYVSSSDPRIGGGSKTTNNDLNLDTNSGVISKLTKSGSTWSKQDLVRGLPRSEENHTANGMALSADGNTLYVAQGGNTNNGATSNNFAMLPEYALSAAILNVNLAAIGATTYDLPTLTDPSVDANDPFGGNDGANQAKLVLGGPVQVHAPGMRNAYDIVRTSANKLFTIDNGGNSGWGDVPIGEGPGGTCTNAQNEPGTSNTDELFDVTAAGTYGGHPNPTRGNKANTFNGQTPVEVAANPKECDFLAPGASGSLVNWNESTNGLAEYTASNFGGEMKGDLLAAGYGNTIERIQLTGGGATTNTLISSAATAIPLDVTAQGDAGPFAGTIWYGDIGTGALFVLEPDESTCNTSLSDSDGDGFTNVDEQANGTSECSAADTPPDFDGDKVSDKTDPNDDNDALPDKSDPFARDAQNGLATTLPVDYQWENEGTAEGGLLGLGFTGLMANGTTDYLTQYDTGKMTVRGAGGITTVDEVDPGDAYGPKNTQKYGFQFGVNARPEVGPFTVQTRIVGPFSGLTPQDFQSMGLFIGTGDQDNYVKITTASNAGTKVEALKEVGGVPQSQTAPLAMPGPDHVDLYLRVDPAAGTVQPSFTAATGATTTGRIDVGGPIAVPLAWFTAPTGLAVGIISTSTGPGPVFPATWDFMKVTPETGPGQTLGGAGAGQTGGGAAVGQTTPLDTTAPALTRARMLRPRFRRSTSVSFRLSEPATVRATVQRVLKGRRTGGRCRPATPRRRSAPPCRRYVRVPGAATKSLQAGTRRMRVSTRFAGRRLRPGLYRLTLTATDAAGNRSAGKRVAFRVVR